MNHAAKKMVTTCAKSSQRRFSIEVLCPVYFLRLSRISRSSSTSSGVTAGSVSASGKLGFIGGFFDAIGGGGWGPVVTSTLMGSGADPRQAIGTTNAAEFFVTTAITAVFVATIGLELWPVILGLVLGGVLAAPLAALVTRKLPDRPLMIIVGVVIMLLSVRNLIHQISAL